MYQEIWNKLPLVAWKQQKRYKEVASKNGPKKKEEAEWRAEYLTDCSFDKANSTALSGESVQVFFKQSRLRHLPDTAKHLTVWWFYKPQFASKNHPRYDQLWS